MHSSFRSAGIVSAVCSLLLGVCFFGACSTASGGGDWAVNAEPDADINAPVSQQPSGASDEPETPSPCTDAPAPNGTENPSETNMPENGNGGWDVGEAIDSIYVTKDYGYSLYYFVRSAAENYARLVNRTHERLGENVDIYSVIAPLSSGIMLDKSIQESVGASDQRAAIEYINSQIDEGVHALNVFDAIKQHSGEYVYFRTDHHWTALGAYYAYTEFCGAKGTAPHELNQFEERNYPGFLGTFYSKSLSDAMKKNPDTVTAYVPMGTNSMTFIDTNGTEVNWSIITNVENYKSGSKYCCFAGSDQPYSFAHNPQVTDGSSCVVIKDSFGNAFIPFLIDHYEYVYWIDFRYYGGTLPELVRDKGIRDVIYCLNIYNAGGSAAADKLKRLVP